MLKGIDNRLNADVLYALRAMGHGDVLILCDTNFPADSIARDTALGELLHMDNLTAGQAAEAILSVLPLDTFVDDFAGRMEVVGKPNELPPVQAEVQAAIDTINQTYEINADLEAFNYRGHVLLSELRQQVERYECSGAVWTQTTDVEGEVNGCK